jgi:dolichol-phosphate mannosyltransferase
LYKNHRILMIAPAFNEAGKIEHVARAYPRDVVDTFLVVDDGSTDETASRSQAAGARVLSHPYPQGVGVSIRDGYRLAREENYDIAVVIAGNNKDDPREVTRLLDPICDDGFDFVMGSRYLPGGAYGGDMPLYRVFATRVLHPWIVRLFCNRKVTETSNGYRAIRVSVLRDPRINLEQPWLKDYQLEMYVVMKVLMLADIKTTEVPVSKIYPPREIGNTKMKPISGWWKMLYPLFLVGLGIRK